MFRDYRDNLEHVVIEHECDEFAVWTYEDRIWSLSSVTIAFFTETSPAYHIDAIAHW